MLFSADMLPAQPVSYGTCQLISHFLSLCWRGAKSGRPRNQVGLKMVGKRYPQIIVHPWPQSSMGQFRLTHNLRLQLMTDSPGKHQLLLWKCVPSRRSCQFSIQMSFDFSFQTIGPSASTDLRCFLEVIVYSKSARASHLRNLRCFLTRTCLIALQRHLLGGHVDAWTCSLHFVYNKSCWGCHNFSEDATVILCVNVIKSPRIGNAGN